ncbi:hypothetical protein GGTG_13896 [Gaeumannomyces tritici R3-111a-1]|uniref:Zn(2)-C6 fungal-type domain-containing protein n=1 Tax=Gaeumannomyces tritici (strain R3-111a-1) TaxID=644352 RepID=J3PK50_GAET3|nr:hypothetical protein GGTG_13896 [Gaeumannomyces tritici R3-111a-1]EJT68527.1 hypothetical protein GGTG_13896 [Gaeumannomyces tritici R3-111a-1]
MFLSFPSGPAHKRIAFACGRCHKRKVRCSGNPGDGSPCSNCESADPGTCQFPKARPAQQRRANKGLTRHTPLQVPSQPTSVGCDGEPGVGSQHMDCGYDLLPPRQLRRQQRRQFHRRRVGIAGAAL